MIEPSGNIITTVLVYELFQTINIVGHDGTESLTLLLLQLVFCPEEFNFEFLSSCLARLASIGRAITRSLPEHFRLGSLASKRLPPSCDSDWN